MKEYGLMLGGSSGMGKEVAKKLLKKNINVWLIARNELKLEQLRLELSEEHPDLDVKVSIVDLYNSDDVFSAD